MRKRILSIRPVRPLRSATGLTALLLLCGTSLSAADDGREAADAAGETAVAATESARSVLTGPVPEPVAPPAPADIERSIERGIEFLLKDQNADGSWGSAQRTKALNIYAPVPGAHHAFRTAVTALCIAALIEAESDRPEVVQSIERGENWLFERLPKLRRANPTAIYNVWGHIYSIQALVRMHDRLPSDAERRQKILQLIESQYDFLDRYESVDGGWGYYDFEVGSKKPASSSMSFVSAAGLIAFHEAKAIGAAPPQRLVDRAVTATLRQRKPDFSYLYGEYLKWRPTMGVNQPAGSLGRSQACNAALRLWGDEQVTDEVMTVWLNRLFARNGWLDIGRKRPIPHEAWFQIAGYFYYFGHYYAALCIEQLPSDQRPPFQHHSAVLMLDRQEQDGSWWDYPLYNYHQPYGTAFALLTLYRCRVQQD
jgi:hypothetical protein